MMTNNQPRRPFGAFIALLAAMASIAAADVSAPYRGTLPLPSTFVGCGLQTEFSDDFRGYVVDLDTASDAESAELRDTLRLPVVDTSLIQFETDSATCHRAAVAHARQLDMDTLNPERVWALRVGSTRYIVFNGTLMGEHFVRIVFDSGFVELSRM
jgi:hypothetical protein